MTTRTKAKTNELPEPEESGDLVSEVSGNLVSDPNIAPLLEPPAPPSSLLQSAIDQQERELAELQTHMDELSEQYATRARAIVLQGLENGRTKARAEILTIDIPSFFAPLGSGSNFPLPKNLAPAPDLEAEAYQCLVLET
jgi:flagellar biosynthesis/type III secretory pathway protein FliH